MDPYAFLLFCYDTTRNLKEKKIKSSNFFVSEILTQFLVKSAFSQKHSAVYGTKPKPSEDTLICQKFMVSSFAFSIFFFYFGLQKTKSLELKRLRWIVLDEADRYLSYCAR